MADGINIDIKSAQVDTYLARLSTRLANMEPAMEDIGAVFEAAVQLRFETKADPLGRPWAPLAASTKARYAKTDGDRRAGTLLERTGRLRASLNYDADARSVRIGFGQEHGQYHEFGTRKMPRRGLLMADPVAGSLAPTDERQVLEVIDDWLREPGIRK